MANNKDNSLWDKTKNTAQKGADVIHDTVDVFGDATSNAAKKMTGKPNTSMENAIEKGD